MKKLILILFCFLFLSLFANAQKLEDDTSYLSDDEVEASLNYQTGIIELESGNATLTVPEGFEFLNKEQSRYVLEDLWGNPEDSSILGLLLPKGRGVLKENSWVFVLSFDEMGYVKDDDAGNIDYDELLEEQQKENRDNNPERIKMGYQPIEFVGWADAPYYDKDNKVLHWAKELKFGEDSLNTLNYNLRILGRKGLFMLNAVASMNELPEVKANVDDILLCIKFKEGHQYADYIPDVDNVAAWTIGGLVAGKILAKAGLFVLIAKFWKIIALAVAAGGSAIWKYFRRND
ncbi:MAG: DUF2167 domain-containing protein [Bacteroidia bacterium]|nr:DUF2167 domain-containing protein [Bacteroidia bacterium]MCF8428063.1 DUF2167 domain-containing protein [Bacteroidia bacterium]MCF8446678.1 DUF2167 domain-containing protein [Bacteroidia bacterium]